MALALRSSAFAHQGQIPTEYTCEGHDVSPPLEWRGVPAGTQSLALVVDDPDAPDPRAPQTTWVHWILYDIPPTATGLPRDAVTAGFPPGTREGLNDWKRAVYGGPCPPVGRHRYFFKLYALDTRLGSLGTPGKPEIEEAMESHVLDRAELVGTYEKRFGRR